MHAGNCSPRTAIKLGAVAAAAALLAACGGGGGGGGGGSSSSGTTSSSVPSVAAGRALMLYIPNGNAVSVSDRSSATSNTVSASETPGTSATVNISGSLSGGTPAPAIGTVPHDLPIGANGNYYQGSSAAVFSFREAGGSSLSDASYGLVIAPGSTSGSLLVGGYHHGTPTPAAELPSGVTATYSGTFAGLGMINGVSASMGTAALTGNMNMTADFGAGTVQGRVNNMQVDSNGATGSATFGLSMNGTISGAGYTGIAGYTTTTGAAGGTVTSSAMSGGFYGANAGETAGALRIEGTAPGMTSPTSIVGGFGGKRQ